MILDLLTKPRATTYRNPADWFIEALTGGGESDSGVKVNAKTALQYSAVWQAVNVISGDLGQLPFNVHKRTPDGKEIDRSHPGYRPMKKRPNPIMNACTFKEVLQSHALIWGNGRAGIVRDGRGNPVWLVPFLPDRSYEEVIDGQLYHFTRLGDSQQYKPFHDRDVFHVKGLSFDGCSGYEVIQLARNSWGLGLAAEKHINRQFKNNARPAVVIESEIGARFTREDALQMLADWNAMHAGTDNTGKTAALSPGFKAHILAYSNEQSQLAELRKDHRIEVAGWFLLPPHKLGDSSKTAYNSLESENRAYINMTLGRWFKAWEEEADEKLLTEKQKREESHFFKFNAAAFLRGDIQSRYAAYQIGIMSEFLSPDEVRDLEDMNKRPDGQGGVFRNPNRKPESEGGTGGEPPPDDKATARQQARNAALTRVEQVLNVEINRVITASRKAANFMGWLDTFYDRWPSTLGEVLREIGGTQQQAVGHASRSKAILIEVAGECTAETLSATVEAETALWAGRAKELVDDIYSNTEA